MTRYKEIDLRGIQTYTAADRPSMVMADIEATPPRAGMSLREFLGTLPRILKAEDLKAIAAAVVAARKKEKPVIAMIGGHVIKTGCSAVISDLVDNGFITHVASNGAAAIHDTELARFGHTSEDVTQSLATGAFGMAADTAELVNGAAVHAMAEKCGLGEAVGARLMAEDPGYLNRALIARCYRARVPYTLHVALGTDIVHQHPDANGAAIGDASLRDFRILAATVSELGNGGVVLNFGSAVIMPEVFLKALSVARNLNTGVTNFVTANFDMIQHYRPLTNVVHRPVRPGGNGYTITGHHEIMIPMLAAIIHEIAAGGDL